MTPDSRARLEDFVTRAQHVERLSIFKNPQRIAGFTVRWEGPAPQIDLLSVSVFVIGAGLLMDLESGFPILRRTSLAGGLVGIIGLGILVVAAEVTSEAITRRDETTHPLRLRVVHLSLLLAAGVSWLALVWLWYRVLGVSQ